MIVSCKVSGTCGIGRISSCVMSGRYALSSHAHGTTQFTLSGFTSRLSSGMSTTRVNILLADILARTFLILQCTNLSWLQLEAEALVHANERDGGLLKGEFPARAAPSSAAKRNPAMLRSRRCLRRPAQEALWQVPLGVLASSAVSCSLQPTLL